ALAESQKGGLLDAVRAHLANKIEGARGAWVVGTLPAADASALREAADVVRGALHTGGAAFAALAEDKVTWLAVVTDDLAGSKALVASDVLKAGGVSGGGKPNLAQGGGKDAQAVPDQLKKMADVLAQRLESAAAPTGEGRRR